MTLLKKSTNMVCVVLAACVITAVLTAWRPASGSESGLESALESNTEGFTEEIVKRDWEARFKHAQHALISRVRTDARTISEAIEPIGTEKYSEKELILINPWHLLPDEYEAELENVEYGHQVDICAAEHLREMLSDCREAGFTPLICSSYRERSKQEILFENDVRRFRYQGYSEEEAREETARNVAVPGSSEHEAGLAVDIVDVYHQSLDENQELNDTQQWLMEHCGEYGFILRYPKDKQEITGITYEPWHYRYVGQEAAQKIMAEEICLEEYLGVIDTGKEMKYSAGP